MKARSAIEMTPRRAGLVLSIALHAAAVGAILSHLPTRAAMAAAAPIMVSLLPPAAAAQPQTPPKPRPVRPRIEPKASKPIEPLPQVAAPAEAPSPFVAPRPAALETPPGDAAPRPTIATAPAAAAVVPPRFDAAYLRNPPPVYPALARRMGEQGRVLLRVLVSAEGTAQRVELKASSGAHRLDRAALEAVQSWRFVPARQDGLAVSAWVLIPISFSLEG